MPLPRLTLPSHRLAARPLGILALLAAGLLLTGCIDVKDVVAKWKASKIDPALEGTWESKGDDGKGKKTLFLKQPGDWYLLTSTGDDKAMAVRTFEAGGHKFMIWLPVAQAVIGFDDPNADKAGKVVHYTLVDGKLDFFTLNQDNLKEAINAKKVAGEVPAQGAPSLASLDDATCAFLGQEAADKAHWMGFATDMRKPAKPLTP